MQRTELTIYLCGKMSGLDFDGMYRWRCDVTRSLMKELDECVRLHIINPVDYYNFTDIRHQTEREVMQFDIECVRRSDVVVANTEGLNDSIGSVIEIYDATQHRIPVIAYSPNSSYSIEDGRCVYKGEYMKLHPWIRECISRVTCSQEELRSYIRDFYVL